MSLTSHVGATTEFHEVDPGYISESAMESMCAAILTENLTPDEMDEFVSESASFDIVTEKTIIKLDKNAKKQRAYKLGILQCAAEDGRKEYKKLRKLWNMEAILFKKLEKQYKNKAMAKAKEAVRKMGRSNSKGAKVAGMRANKQLGATGSKTLLGGGIATPKKKK